MEGIVTEGLRITVCGVAWLFAGLALVWVLVALLHHFFPGEAEGQAPRPGTDLVLCTDLPVEAAATEAPTEERAQVAAIVAAALRAGALQRQTEAPARVGLEQGYATPNWVTGNRSRAMQPWQPPRCTEE
jgi:Na+-transporting methylmalonyl-CoA/oxaloacetate decarboxylase gamma subunit